MNPAYETRGHSLWLARAIEKLLHLRYGAGGGSDQLSDLAERIALFGL